MMKIGETKTEKVEINLEDFSKEELIGLIQWMNEESLTLNQAIEKILIDFINKINDN